MENEVIKPWAARFTDPRGVEVETVGVDVVNHRVIFMRPGYPYPCAQPRELWGRKFRRVSA